MGATSPRRQTSAGYTRRVVPAIPHARRPHRQPHQEYGQTAAQLRSKAPSRKGIFGNVARVAAGTVTAGQSTGLLRLVALYAGYRCYEEMSPGPLVNRWPS